MTDNDRAALEEALAVAMKMPGRAEQLAGKLRDESRVAVAQFAAYLAQGEALGLSPHESPPCEVEPGWIDAILDDGDTIHNAAFYGAAVLLRRMLEAGVSRWHPDPIGALREAECTARPN